MKQHIKDIVPENSKGELHGYQEWYSDSLFNGILRHRGYRINDMHKGYTEWHSSIIHATEFYIR